MKRLYLILSVVPLIRTSLRYLAFQPIIMPTRKACLIRASW